MQFRNISAIIRACSAHEQRSLEYEYQFWDYGYNGSGN